MINQIRADFYRQLRTWGFGLVMGLTVVYCAVCVWFKSVGGVMVNAPLSALDELTAKQTTVRAGIRGATINSSVLLYVFIALFVIVIGYEFSQQTYKNTLISGISRLQFILAKYLTLLLDLFIALALFYLTALITGRLAGRAWGTALPHLLQETGLTLVTSTFFISVVFSLAMLVLIASGSLVISAVFIVIWPLAVSLGSILTNWHWLSYIDFFNVAAGISFGTIHTGELWRYLLVSVVALTVSVLAGAELIQHKEL
ncbi:ABC transporter permease [Lacticaseibacillus absianus]|uniref:ABC transporter permease n=1 Tax=Lacticaseibacillus absianus TaxID=2729623 RepID=UPI0015C9A51B|nr:ABC transporter permease [Lacticaseibacillus absianus]